MAATGAASVRAFTANPAGASTTVSEWLIQTVPSAGRSARRTPGARTLSPVRPYSRTPVGSTRPPSASAMACWP